MKRVLVILPNLDLGGTETIVMNYFRHFDEIVFDFVVHGEKGFYEDEAVSLGAKIFRAPTRGAGFFANIRAMCEIYRNHDYDTVIVCTEHAFAFIELAVAQFCGVRTRAVWSHFSDYQGASKWKRRANFLARPILRFFANLFLACTNDAAKWLFGCAGRTANTVGTSASGRVLSKPGLVCGSVKKLGLVRGFVKKPFYIVNNAIDPKEFAYCPLAREKIRSFHNISGKFVIGMVGRLVPVKNHAFALQIISRLDENFVLLLVGDGELRSELEALAPPNVIFAGKRENVAEYYQAFDMLILPSLHEGFGLVAIEAQAASLPVLLSSAVPQETKITPLAYSLSLEDGVDAWVRQLRTQKEDTCTRILSNSDDFENSGFHIVSEAKKLQEILSR